jgi:hypothetical protein
MRFLTKSRIIGVGMTPLMHKSGLSATFLMQNALELALGNAAVRVRQLDGIIAVPSLAEPRFMEAHYLATRMGILPQKGVIARTIDTGGAGPISGLLEADKMIRLQGCDLVAVVAGDAVSSLPTDEFLRRADSGCNDSEKSLPSPVIPSGYDRIAQWHINNKGFTREQLAMVAVLMSRQAVRHPYALTKKPLSLDYVLSADLVAPVTSRLECARRADGAAAIIVASTRFINEQKRSMTENGPLRAPFIIGGGKILFIDMFSSACSKYKLYVYLVWQARRVGHCILRASSMRKCLAVNKLSKWLMMWHSWAPGILTSLVYTIAFPFAFFVPLRLWGYARLEKEAGGSSKSTSSANHKMAF